MQNIILKGESDYQIIIPTHRTQAESYAAEQLQDALFSMTGAKLPVRWASQRLPDRPAILVGRMEDEQEPGLWDRDSYEILPQGRDLVLRGTARRGTIYAVQAFLEWLGARFYGPHEVSLPHRREVPLPSEPRASTAAFSYRHVFYPTAQVPEWAVRWKLNVHNGADSRWGPNARAHSWGHSFASLVPGRRYFADHPEYFSLVDGVRRSHRERYNHQLCCTNPEVVDVAAESLARRIEQHPDRRIFAVGQNDGAGYCECPRCAAVDEQEGSHMGQVLTLVNRVAERFPDRIIATLSYAWSVEPPRNMHARDNVLIVLCHNRGCFTHALDACELNEDFLSNLRGWNERANHILIWDYFVNYHSYLMPTPNFRRIEADLRTYRDNGVTGMFCQGSAVRGGQFEGLRQYLLARLLWDPDQEAWPILEDWARGVYGHTPGDCILEYLKMLHDHVDGNDVHMPSFGAGQEIQPEIFTPEVLEAGKELWDQAERAATTEEPRRKVFAARAPEMCSRLFHAGIKYVVEEGRLRPRPEPDLVLRDRFVRAAILGDAAHLRENDGAPEEFGRYYGRSYEAVILETDELRAVIIPEMGGRLFSMTYRDGGIELMHKDDLVRMVNYMPCHSGYEFSVEPVWKGAGTEEVYEVVEREEARVVLRAALKDGLVLRTRFALSGGDVTVRHTVRNKGTEPVTVSPFTHPEWNYEAFGAEAELRMREPEGEWRTTTLNPEDRTGRNLPFEGDKKPAGAWRLRSAVHPIKVREEFDPEAVAHTRLNLSTGGGNVNLELHFHPVEIAPGKKRRFWTKWKIGTP